MFVLCLALWLLVCGGVTWEFLGFGIVISAGVTWAGHRMTGMTLQKELALLRKLPVLLHLAGHLLREIFRANLAVIRLVYGRRKPESCYTEFSAPLHTTAARTALADCITLTPGTITAELDGDRFTVHCLDRPMGEGLEQSGFVRLLQKAEDREAQHDV